MRRPHRPRWRVRYARWAIRRARAMCDVRCARGRTRAATTTTNATRGWRDRDDPIHFAFGTRERERCSDGWATHGARCGVARARGVRAVCAARGVCARATTHGARFSVAKARDDGLTDAVG